MTCQSDLEKLSVAEKDQLIRELWPLRALVRDLAAQVSTLQLKCYGTGSAAGDQQPEFEQAAVLGRLEQAEAEVLAQTRGTPDGRAERAQGA